MSTLYQGMYADPSCNTFGLQYKQTRTNSVIRDAAWYSDKGEKLGVGDLSIKDMINIRSGLKQDEKFFVLSEIDALSIPFNLNRLSPGIQIILEKCSWMISQADIFKIDDNQKADEELYTVDSIDVVKIPRSRLFDLCCRDPVIAGIVCKPAALFGLDLYVLPNKKEYLVGTLEQCKLAVKKYIERSLWLLDIESIKKYSVKKLTDNHIKYIPILQSATGEKSNYYIEALIGSNLSVLVEDSIAREGICSFLSMDNIQRNSSDIPGLPPDLLAFKISYNDKTN